MSRSDPHPRTSPDPHSGPGGSTAVKELTHRTEQALLGALLSDAEQVENVYFLSAADFADAGHQALYEAIRSVHAYDAATSGVLFTDQVALLLGRDAEELHSVALTCPEPDHATVYARTIQEMAFRRDMAAHAERITQSAQDAGQPRELAHHLDELAKALAYQAERFAPLAEVDTDGWFAVDRPSLDAKLAQALRESEDMIVADLLRHPDQVPQAATFLSPADFSFDEPRLVYSALATLDARGEPIDEITVAWNLARLAAAVEAVGPLGVTTAGPPIDYDAMPAYLMSLSKKQPEPYSALDQAQLMRATALRAEAAAFALRAGEQAARLDLPARRIVGAVSTAARNLALEHLRHNRPAPPQPRLDPELDGSDRRIGRGL